MVLVGDIGGTKTVLALVPPDRPRDFVAERRYPGDQYPSLEAIITEYLTEGRKKVRKAVLGIAGPVRDGVVSTTNLPWRVSEEELSSRFDFDAVRIINDLEAVARAVPVLADTDLDTLYEGEPVDGGPIAVVAPGTGLGEAFLTMDDRDYRAHASEGGHRDFAPRDAREENLLRFARERFDHVSYERVCSGPGVALVYEFLRDAEGLEEPSWLAEKLSAVTDRTPMIVETAVHSPGSCTLCDETLRLFTRILAAEAGNFGLTILATGGLYLGGGMPPRIMPFLTDRTFIDTLQAKGRMRPVMESMPVRVIMNAKANLIGAACRGKDL